jgi:hypothetical protein
MAALIRNTVKDEARCSPFWGTRKRKNACSISGAGVLFDYLPLHRVQVRPKFIERLVSQFDGAERFDGFQLFDRAEDRALCELSLAVEVRQGYGHLEHAGVVRTGAVAKRDA